MKKKNQEAVTGQTENNIADVDVSTNAVAEEKTEAKKEEVQPTSEAVDDTVDHILKCYPQYEAMFIDKNGFVFPADAPEYQRKDAILYKNKYFKK